jgi:IS30 family transposase
LTFTDKKAQTIITNQKKVFSNLPAHLRRTLTMDNGTEFANHYELTKHLNMQTYFCNPHSPWQKGGIENINGRLRRYLPLSTDISSLSQTDLQILALQMNSTPRKCLGYKAPIEVLSTHLLHFKCELTKNFPLSNRYLQTLQ